MPDNKCLENDQDTTILGILMKISKKTRTMIALRLAEIGLATGEDESCWHSTIEEPRVFQRCPRRSRCGSRSC